MLKEKEPRRFQDQLLEALEARDLHSFKELLSSPDVDPNHKYKDPYCCTCIEVASRNEGCEEFVRVLLQAGVKPNVNTLVPEPIHYAASGGLDATLQVLLADKRTRVNAVDPCGRTALHLAVKNFNQEAAERYGRCIAMLMAHPNININKRNKQGVTAIYEAVKCGERTAVLMFLKHDVNGILDMDASTRHLIAERFPDLLAYLPPTPSAHFPALEDQHCSMLIKALRCRDLVSFRDLLRQVDSDGTVRIDPNHWLGKPFNATVLQVACRERGAQEFVATLLLAGADPNTGSPLTGKSPLHCAVDIGNHRAIRILLADKRTKVNVQDGLGRTALHVAAEQHFDCEQERLRLHKCVITLLQHPGIDANVRQKDGRTPLRLAAEAGNQDMVQLLLEYCGKQLDLDDDRKITKTTRSIITENFVQLRRLLPQESVVEDREDLRERLFQTLYGHHAEEFLRTFDDNTVAIKQQKLQDADDGSMTFLQYACNMGLKNVAQKLLEHGADPNATSTGENRPPAILASVRGHRDILKLFLDLPNLQINAADDRGNTALHYAARNGDLSSVIALLRRGADIGLRNIYDTPPLPAKTIEALLDSSLRTSAHFPNDEDYEIVFDYEFLLAKVRSDPPIQGVLTTDEHIMPLMNNSSKEQHSESDIFSAEMDLLYHISCSKDHQQLLTHPIITSFLHLKWLKLKTAFFTHLIIYVIFLLLLNVYILMEYGLPSENINMYNSSIVNFTMVNATYNQHNIYLTKFRETYGTLIYVLLILILVCHTTRELFKFVMSPTRYILTLEKSIDLCLIITTGLVLFKTWEDKNSETVLAALAIFLSWIELPLLTGQFGKLSTNIQMFKSVCSVYSFAFLSYFFFVVAFSFGFYVLYKGRWTIFSTPASAITDTVVLMTGGFYLPPVPRTGYSAVIILLFVFINMMIILNIMTGLAVNTIIKTQEHSKQMNVASRILLLYSMESNLIHWNSFMERMCKYKIFSKISMFLRKSLVNITLFPYTESSKKYISVLPNRNAVIIFPNAKCSIDCKMNLNTLQVAMNLISKKGTAPHNDQLKQQLNNFQEKCNEKFVEIYHALDVICAKQEEHAQKLEKVYETVSQLQNKQTSVLNNIEQKLNMSGQNKLQSYLSQQLLPQLNHYENRFNWLDHSQRKTIDLLIEILNNINDKLEKKT